MRLPVGGTRLLDRVFLGVIYGRGDNTGANSASNTHTHNIVARGRGSSTGELEVVYSNNLLYQLTSFRAPSLNVLYWIRVQTLSWNSRTVVQKAKLLAKGVGTEC